MTDTLLQIVDEAREGATILADLNNRSPLFIVKDGWSAPPPALSRTSARSSLVDGDITTGSSYSDRVIEVSIGVDVESPEDAAAFLQPVERLLDRKNFWLKWHTADMAKPVYFRAKRAEITEYTEFNGATAFKIAALRIPADPFAYGEEVTGSFTVANDTFVHEWTDPIEGDVATPLCLTFPQIVELKTYTTVTSSVARRDDTQSAPFVKPLSGTGAVGSTTSGWSATDTADATTLSGTRRRLARAAAGTSSSQIATPALLSWPDLPAGEYRVLVRARLVAGTDVSLVFAGGAVGVVGHTVPTVTFPIRNAPSTGAGWDWYDLGDVVSLPANNPRPDDMFLTTAPITAQTYWSLYAVSASITTLDLDSVLLLPVGGPGVVSARTSMSRAPSTVAAKTMTLDGVSDRRYFDQAGFLGNFDAIAGELPVLVPGANNTLHLMTSTAVNATASAYTGYADFKVVSTLCNYVYRPRYVAGFRPAAS